MPELQATVFSNLDSAVENGYSFEGFTDEDVALDLIAFAEDCEDFTVDELLPHVRAWRAKVKS